MAHRMKVRLARATLSATVIVTALAAVSSAVAAEGPALEVGPGIAQTPQGLPDPPCDGTLLITTDGVFENGYAWNPPVQSEPDFGGFAEAFTAQGTVCGMRVYLTTLPLYYNDETADAFVYSSDGTNPDLVLSVTTGIVLDPPGVWPEITVHEIPLAPTPVDGEFFLYFWGNFEDGLGWFVAADVHGPAQGKPRTKFPEGVGYPSGWHDVEIGFGATDAMGIGAYVDDTPVPARTATWGRIKGLYRP